VVALGLRGQALLMLLLEPLIQAGVVVVQEIMLVAAGMAAQAVQVLSFSNTQSLYPQ